MTETRATDVVDGPDFGIAFDNTFARSLEGGYVPWLPRVAAQPTILKFNHAVAEMLGLDAARLTDVQGAAMLAGSVVPRGAAPLAQAYAGHQFGGFSPRLGDGRALLLGEVIDRTGIRRDIAMKGSGRTPFSRGGDGLAAVGPMLREYIVSEAMHGLGIPTTRALAVARTGEHIRRETMLPGAVLTRVAASHLRVGTFQYFAARQEHDLLKTLLDYSLARHVPDGANAADPALALLSHVCERQAGLIAHWMSVGFIHGVMNTDNMTVSGETIDYGPCAFMETFDAAAVFSSIDHHGRYAYSNQPSIAQWNLARLAEALLPLLNEDGDAAIARVMPILEAFPAQYETQWSARMKAKLGFSADADRVKTDALAREFLQLLQTNKVDFTLGFRRLADVLRGDTARVRALHATANEAGSAAFDTWAAHWQAAHDDGRSNEQRAMAMDAANPIAIARNHLVEAALSDASANNDLSKCDRLLAAVANPFVENETFVDLYAPASAGFTEGFQTFCGT